MTELTEWLERNGFIKIQTPSLTDDEVEVLKRILGEPLKERTMRLIDADVLLDTLSDRLIKVSDRYGSDSAVAGAISGAMKLVYSQPTIEPKRKKGTWIAEHEKEIPLWKCSCCGQLIYSGTEYERIAFHAYCNRCGADMRGTE